MESLHIILFMLFPYIAITTAICGVAFRFKNLPLTWKTESTHLLESKWLRIGSILFHIGMINLLLGHVFGLLTSPDIYHGIFHLDTATKQKIEIIMGFFMTPPALIGALILLWRRKVDSKVANASKWGDEILLIALILQLILGFLTIPQSLKHLDGSVMVLITSYTRGLATFDMNAYKTILDIHWIYKAHILFGFCFVLALPFTKLVHVLSGLMIVRYILRPWQVSRISPRKKSL